MFSAFNRLLGNITVRETPTTISLEGLPGNTFGKDITKTWGTNKLASYMFTQLTTMKASFDSFFAVEVLYMLQQLMDAPVKHGVNKRALQKAIDALLEESWLKDITLEHPDILNYSKLNLFKKPPLEHQTKFLHRYNEMVPKYHLRGYLLAAEPGAGKTLNSLYVAECVEPDFVVMLPPKKAVYKVWEKTLLEEYKEPQKAFVWDAQQKLPANINDYKYYIFHHENLEPLRQLASKMGGRKIVVIIDESHNLNETSAKRTQLTVEFCRNVKAEHVIWASGTPIKAMGYETIPLISTIDPFFTADVETRFKKIFGKSSTKAIDILRNRIGLVSMRIPKSQFTDMVPEEHEVKVKIPTGNKYTLDYVRMDMTKFIDERLAYYKKNMKMYEKIYEQGLDEYRKHITTPDQKKNFKEYQRAFATIRKGYDPQQMQQEAILCNKFERQVIMPVLQQPLRNQFKDCRSVLKYLNLKVAGEALGRVLGKRRAECNAALVEYAGLPKIIANSEKKTLIFTSYVEVLQQTNTYLKKNGFQPVLVYGETNKDLPKLVDTFESNPRANPLVATFPSLSTAVPLTVANTVILLNQPFREHDRLQAISRADRIGQDTQVEVWNILLDTGNKPNISTRAAEIVQWSKEQVASIMGYDLPDIENTSVEELCEMARSDDWQIVLNTFNNFIDGPEYSGIVTRPTPRSIEW
nr:MAG: SNF2 family N-terminal domain [Bacteriophage sp.]